MTKDLFKLLPEGQESKISTSLAVKELSAIARASKSNCQLFKPLLIVRVVEKLLQHVVRGNQNAAKDMLLRQPDLLIKKGLVTDYSGRTFHDVSAWQCMLWALDTRYMGQMMLLCVPAGKEGAALRKELLKQFDAMEQGIHYEAPDMSPNSETIHYCDSHYDFGVIDALQKYIRDRDDKCEDRDAAIWMNTVAKAQRWMPANGLQHYCDPDTAFQPLPDFKAQEFKRCDRFYNWISEESPHSGAWSHLFSGSSLDSGFGSKFSLIRAKGRAEGSDWNGDIFNEYATEALLALHQLYKVRMNDAQQLKDKLHPYIFQAATHTRG